MTGSRRLFASFFLGGFECSSHRRFDCRHLDLIAGTGHDRLAATDFASSPVTASARRATGCAGT